MGLQPIPRGTEFSMQEMPTPSDPPEASTPPTSIAKRAQIPSASSSPERVDPLPRPPHPTNVPVKVAAPAKSACVCEGMGGLQRAAPACSPAGAGQDPAHENSLHGEGRNACTRRAAARVGRESASCKASRAGIGKLCERRKQNTCTPGTRTRAHTEEPTLPHLLHLFCVQGGRGGGRKKETGKQQTKAVPQQNKKNLFPPRQNRVPSSPRLGCISRERGRGGWGGGGGPAGK